MYSAAISISDNGIGREKAAELKSKTATHKSHGLKVTSQRIEMMNKLNSTGAKVNIFDMKDDQGNAMGTKVELIIPVLLYIVIKLLFFGQGVKSILHLIINIGNARFPGLK